MDWRKGLTLDERIQMVKDQLARLEGQKVEEAQQAQAAIDAGVPELAHSGIDDRIAGTAALPGGERLLVARPGKVVEIGLQVLGGEVRMVVEQVAAELAPAQFAQELVDA